MGFPSSGSGRLIDPSTLSPEARREIDRRIFGPLPDNVQQYIRKLRDRLTVTFDIEVIEDDLGAYWESDSEDDFHPKKM